MLDGVLKVVLDVWDAVDMVDIGHSLLGDRKKKQTAQMRDGSEMETPGADPRVQKQRKTTWEK